LNLIGKSKTICIVGHVRPDGDAVGSALALRSALLKMGKDVDVCFDSEVPKQFSYLEGFDKIKTLRLEDGNHDLLIVVDVNTADRLGAFEDYLDTCKKILCFDHHLGFAIFADVALSNPKAASCGEIIYDFFHANKIEITKPIADALYTAIATDTGCFLYPSTSPSTHLIAAELMKLGADYELVNYNNFRVFDRRLIVGLKQVLHNLRFYYDGRVALSYLKKKRSRGYKYDDEERHRFKQFASDVRGVLVSAFLTLEDGEGYRVSLRSHGNYNVEPVARSFGGGGHKNASGFVIKGRYRKVVKKIIAALGNVVR
jgi:phosphoesterase RecJ-like protein